VSFIGKSRVISAAESNTEYELDVCVIYMRTPLCSSMKYRLGDRVSYIFYEFLIFET